MTLSGFCGMKEALAYESVESASLAINMTDVFSPQKRSAIMSCIKGHDNKATEGRLIGLLRKHAITGWRRRAKVFGRPDFVFYNLRVAIFIDGCFWHGCPEHGSIPASNVSFWQRKIARNQFRDRTVNRLLRRSGWRVVRIWQHELRRANEDRLLRRIRLHLARRGLSPRGDADNDCNGA